MVRQEVALIVALISDPSRLDPVCKRGTRSECLIVCSESITATPDQADVPEYLDSFPGPGGSAAPGGELLVSCLLYTSAAGDHAEPGPERRPRCHLGCAHNVEESQIAAPGGGGGGGGSGAAECVTARNRLFCSRSSRLAPSHLLSTDSRKDTSPWLM